MNETMTDGAVRDALTDSVLERLAARLGQDAGARTIYGEAVRQDGVTVIPVARVRFGFGMGRGKNSEGGEGGGAGVQVNPAGYIEIRDGQVTFRSIRSMLELVPVIVAGGLCATLLLRGLRRLTGGHA